MGFKKNQVKIREGWHATKCIKQWTFLCRVKALMPVEVTTLQSNKASLQCKPPKSTCTPMVFHRKPKCYRHLVCVHTWIYIWIHTRTHMYVYIYGQVADVCAHITHIQLATTQLWDAWSHPHSEKDLLLLQAQLVVLVSLLSLTHFQQSRACQKHKKPDWVSVKSRQN